MYGKKSARIISFVVLLMLIISLFAGCGKAEEPSSNITSTSVTNTNTAQSTQVAKDKYQPDNNKKYVINWVPVANAPPDANSEMELYWESKFNVDIKFTFLEPSQREQQLSIKFASGDIPDIFPVSPIAKLGEYVSQELLLDIPEEVFSKYAPSIYASVTKAGKGNWDLSKVGGKIYGLPNLTGHNQFRSPVIWRDDWLKNVGITKLPETLAEAEAAFYKFRNDDPDKNGKKDTYAFGQSGLDMIYGAHGYIPGYWAVKDGKIIAAEIQPEMKKALQTLAKYYKDGILDPEFIGSENKGGYWALSHDFINNRIGITCIGAYYHWKEPFFTGDYHGPDDLEFKKANPSATYAHGVPVKGPDGKIGVKKPTLLSYFTGIGKQVSKEPDKLGKILQMADALEGNINGYITRYYGIEGKHYKMEDGIPKPLGNFADVKELSKIGAHTIFSLALMPETLFVGYKGWDKWATDKKYNIGGIENMVPINLPSSSKYQAELTKLQQETYAKIITGDKPIEYFDQFVTEWNKIGGEQLIKEANEWYAKMK